MLRSDKNIIKPNIDNRSMFIDGFKERYDLEQYFWTENTVNRLLQSLKFIDNCCCLTTPSLGEGFFRIGREEVVLDIDTRFDYLPKFRYFDIRTPEEQEEEFKIIILDPPFFYLSMEQIYKAVLTITKNDFNTKILIEFLRREEKILLETDAPYLTPVPFRGSINEPAFVRNVAVFGGTSRHISEEAIESITTANAQALFNLKT